jgi:chromosome segregation ATPase
VRHPTHPEIRRAITNKWSTQIQDYAKKFNHNDVEENLPRKPLNAWSNKIIMINDPESFPKIQEKNLPKKDNQNNRDQNRAPEKNLINDNEFEKRIREIEEKMCKKFEEKIQKLEEKCNNLQEKLTSTLQAIERLTEAFQASEERSNNIAEKQTEIIKNQLQEFEKILKDRKTESMECEPTDSRKRNVKGKGKNQNDDDFLP